MRDAALRQSSLRRERFLVAILAAALVLGCLLGDPTPTTAARPNAQAAAEFLARERGGRASDYAVVYQRPARLATGEMVWAAKLVDRRTGAVSLVYRDLGGGVGGPELLRGRERAAAAKQTALERKASRSLQRAVQGRLSRMATTRKAGAELPVTVWLSADVAAAEQAVVNRHPEVAWVAGRPLANDLATIRSLRAELWSARRGAYAAAAGALRDQVHRLGGRVAYASTSAPVVFLDLPATAVASLARRDDVVSLGLEGAWSPSMSTAGRAVDANWTSSAGDRGNGVRVAVVEYHNVRRTGDLAGKVVRSHSTTGKLAYTGGATFDHPTWVAGAVAGQSGTWRGVAPGASIVSSGTGGYNVSLAYDRRIIAAADWAVAPGGGDADIVNTSLVQDTATGAEEGRRYFDSLVDQDGRLAISAAGNYVNFGGWQIGSPGTGYNVLTVGGVDDRGTSGRSDDRIWYVPGSNGSNWLDRPGDPWNAHGDYNKPNLVAPAVGVRTANGLAASGTSVATPIVAGVAAQLLANEPVLAAWPEGARAVLMAGAIHRVPMPNGSRNVDHEGVGMTSAYWTNLIAGQGDNQFGGYVIGSLQRGQEPRQQVSVRAGDRLRVALAWNSHTRGTSNLSKTDVLRADLDLRVIGPTGSVVGSYTIDNAYEFVEVGIPSTGTATIEIRQSRFDGPSETYGLAWAKVRDTRRPGLTSRVPAHNEPWAVPSTQVRASFSEPVLNVGGSTFSLVSLANGRHVSASVSYAAASRTATLVPSNRLSTGWYEARVSGGVTDRAGNGLPAATWRFRIVRGSPPAGGGLDRRLRLRAGTHVGYQFDSSGTVIRSRTLSVGSSARAAVNRRTTQPGKPGYWVRVTSGGLSGYWLRESSAAGIIGRVGRDAFDPTLAVVLRAGTHVAHRFSAGGAVTASKTSRPTTSVTLRSNERAVINGAWRLRIAVGSLKGYWVNESSVAYLPGAVQVTDLDTSRAAVRKGTRTAHRYDSQGKVMSYRTDSLSSTKSASTAAWAVVNGRPVFYFLTGPWAAYWLGESRDVHLP